MSSKYDTFWQENLSRIVPLFQEAQTQGSSQPLDASGLRQLGKRQSWHGKLGIADGVPVYASTAFMSSLGQVLTGQIPEWASRSAWTIMVSPRSELTVRQGDIQDEFETRKSPVDVPERLEQWIQEATDRNHPNYYHADLDDPSIRYSTIMGLLGKLRTAPESFSEADALSLFGTLNSGQRMKTKVVKENSLPTLRQAVLDLVDGDGPASERIKTASGAIRYAGPSMFGELYGWAHADSAPLYNSCATDALAYLGYSFNANDYDAFVNTHEQFKQTYKEIVGRLQPDLPINLEIDKLYNVIDKVDLKKALTAGPFGKPFDQMFQTWDEAQWAFELLETAAEQLGLEGPDDPMAAFSLRRIGREHRLQLVYGSWLVAGVGGYDGSMSSVFMALFSDQQVVKPMRSSSFKLAADQRPVSVQVIDPTDAQPVPPELLQSFLATLDYAKEFHAKWSRSNFHSSQKRQIALAVFDKEARDQLLKEGMELTSQRFWKISPGDDAWNWDACQIGGFIAIGWDELGDLTNVDRAGFEIKCREYLASHPDETKAGMEQVWRFRKIQQGDGVIANRGTKEILGIGTVTGPYEFVPEVRHGHRLPVEWHEIKRRAVEEPGWRRTVIELDPAKWERLTEEPPDGPPTGEPPQDAAFTEQAFELLAGIHGSPTKDYYLANKDGFKAHVEEPFQRVLQKVASLLPPQIAAVMETKDRLYGRFLKNDYGKGGAWDFYWGAFYPKGGKRTEDAQLSLWVNHERMEYGFYIGEYGSDQRKRFEGNSRKHASLLAAHFEEVLPEGQVYFGAPDNFAFDDQGNVQVKVGFTWEEFLREPGRANNDVSVILPRQRVMTISEDALVQQILDSFVRLYPLVILAKEDDPLPVINHYWQVLGNGEPPEPAQPYDREDFLTRTSFLSGDADDLHEMLQDKRQVILFGPPGTGKTYVARELARWITGLSNPSADRVEMIQFHPAYSYEDFIEGIRPESTPTSDGRFQVDYPPRPGVFSRFCSRALAAPDEPFVFIIDEINRGNIPRIFGELMLLLEYRDQDVPLPYSGKRFRIPENVYLIGTMNTADRSIALVDFALRRRFHFFHFGADPDLFKRWLEKNPSPIPYLAQLYERLAKEAIDDPNFAVGPSYFMDPNLTEVKLARVWRRSIEPYLAEYHVDQRPRAERWHWDGELIRSIRGQS